jgi:hypothetical protein
MQKMTLCQGGLECSFQMPQHVQIVSYFTSNKDVIFSPEKGKNVCVCTLNLYHLKAHFHH